MEIKTCKLPCRTCKREHVFCYNDKGHNWYSDYCQSTCDVISFINELLKNRTHLNMIFSNIGSRRITLGRLLKAAITINNDQPPGKEKEKYDQVIAEVVTLRDYLPEFRKSTYVSNTM